MVLSGICLRSGVLDRATIHVRQFFLPVMLDITVITAVYTLLCFTAFFGFTGNRHAFFLMYCVSLTLTIACLFGFKVYHRIWSQSSGNEVVVIIQAMGLATVMTLGLVIILFPEPVPRAVVLIAQSLSLLGFVVVRYRLRLIRGASWRWKAIWRHEFPKVAERVLIIGTGLEAQGIVWQLKRQCASGNNDYVIVGFVDGDPQKQSMYVEGVPILGRLRDIPTLARRYQIDLIIVALNNVSGPDFRQVLSYCEQTNARIKNAPNVFAHLNSKNGCALLRDIQPEDLLGRRTVTWHQGVDNSPVSEKVVLVTGAAGSIGSELCRHLLSQNPVKLIMLDNNESGLHDLMIELSTQIDPARLVPILADITNRERMARLFSANLPDVVFHSAAYKHVPLLQDHPIEAARVNIGGTRNVAELSCQFGVERFVLISTDKAVAPQSVMGASKRLCELLISALAQQNTHNTLLTAVRFGNVLGSRGSVVPIFERQIDMGGPVTVTDVEMTRYFMSIPEAAHLVIQAACLTEGNEIFMLRMGDAVKIIDLAERMIRLRGLRPYIDIPIQVTGIRPGEKLYEALHEEAEIALATPHPDILKLVCDHHRFRSNKFMFWIDALLKNGVCHEGGNPVALMLAIMEASKHLELETAVSLAA
ncbi:MAG: polysaccharide biosynthesis protein [Anaerolineae bacterium]|nr:polysaccharide biosynthesis protein [Anaerolineae bacterium]